MSDERLTISIRGLEAFGRHGVHDTERELGQRFVVDLDLELSRLAAVRSDDLADTVDYAALAQAVAAIVTGPPVRLLERLAGLIADRALTEAGARAVTVTVRKPHVALPQVVSETSVTLHRTAQ